MKITILTVGTRGDVEPCLALALGLNRAGHETTLATGTNFASFVAGRGVRFAPIRADFLAFFQSADGQALLDKKYFSLVRPLPPAVVAMRQRMLEDSWEAVRSADAIVYHPRVLGAYDAAEKLRIPAILAVYLPQVTPTREFPLPFVPRLRLGRLGNRLSYAAVHLGHFPFQGMRNRWRVRVLGLPPLPWYANEFKRNGRPLPVLYHYSRHVVPPPADWRGPIAVTGYWFLDPDPAWRPPADLLAFLEAGPPPVFVGFGSMIGRDPKRLTETVVAALKQAGRRGILVAGWGGMSGTNLPETIFRTEGVPYDWLFPRVAAVVHHGGAGTTGLGLRAGKPTVICPYFHDQPYWGKVVHELGAGPAPIPQWELTAERLAAAIRSAVTDEGMRRRSEELGAKIRAEDGIARAVAAIEGFLQRFGEWRGVSPPVLAVPAGSRRAARRSVRALHGASGGRQPPVPRGNP
jgi:sterol 3beta-glucosyltransferase